MQLLVTVEVLVLEARRVTVQQEVLAVLQTSIFHLVKLTNTRFFCKHLVVVADRKVIPLAARVAEEAVALGRLAR